MQWLDFNKASTFTAGQLAEHNAAAASQIKSLTPAELEAMLAKAKEQARTTTGKLLSPDRAEMGSDSSLYGGEGD